MDKQEEGMKLPSVPGNTDHLQGHECWEEEEATSSRADRNWSKVVRYS